MKDVLIINLTRMGDLLQTTPAIVALKENFPDIRITLLVNTAFKEICEYLPFVDRYIDMDEIAVAKAAYYNKLIEGYKYIKKILNKINDRVYDLVINFTNSASSSIITTLINAKEVRGISIDRKGFILKEHPWVRYIFNVLPSRNVNPFHLCDMHVKAAGVTLYNKRLHLIVKDEKRRWVKELLMSNGVNENDLLIALQLGASTEDKRWPIEHFARLADKLSKELNANILLTGAPWERELGETFSKICDAKIINMIGKTDLTELAALIERSKLLVSNDTGTLHIATAVGTTTIDLSLASVHFRETGPYGEGHYVITATIPCYPCNFMSNCEYWKCKKIMTPDAVYELCRTILTDSIENLNANVFKDLQIYQSVFDHDGLIVYIPLLRLPAGVNDLFTYIYRYTWQIVLDRRPFEKEDAILSLIEEKMAFYEENPEIYDRLLEYAEGFKRLSELIDAILSVMGVMQRHSINEHTDISLIEKLWENIEPVDQEIEKLAYVVPYIKPIYIMLKYEKEAFKGEDLKSVIEEAITAYKYARWQADIIYRLLKNFVANRRLNLTLV